MNCFLSNDGPDSDVQLNVFPNPFEETFFLEHNFQEGIARVELYSVQGQPVFRDLLPAAQHTLQLNPGNLPPGYYQLVVTCAGQLIRTPLIKIQNHSNNGDH